MEYVGKTIISVLDSATDDLSTILMKHLTGAEAQTLIVSAQEQLVDLLATLKECNQTILIQELEATSDDLNHIEKSIQDAHTIVKGAQRQLKTKAQFYTGQVYDTAPIYPSFFESFEQKYV